MVENWNKLNKKVEYFEEINHRKKLKKVNPMKRRSTKIEGISEK